MLEINDLRVDYDGRTVLAVDHLAVAPGECVAVVGPSGAGKTTLLRSCNGTVPAAAGGVAINGRLLSDMGERELRRTRSELAFIPQDLALVPELRVVANVLAGGFGRGGLLTALRALLKPRRADTQRAFELLQRVGVGDKLYQRSDKLSGGEQQRVAVARALFGGPRVLLADEPVASVDPERARDTLALLLELAREQGFALLVSLHNLELARGLFGRLLGLRRGRLLFDCAPAELGDYELEALYALDPSEDEQRD
ncbi:MAG: ATP-binding cassette domain-containing protein [Deltaproteobacteria bacterium]|nr:ATP-binding cassette domain-containing protein [Deltaproteobacteria bacterium]